jgi:methyl-accepting chemotaxis protein
MRSAESAKSTSSLIEEAVRNAEDGVAANAEALSRLREIAAGASKVSEVMGEIAAASDQQRQGIDQVSEGMTQLDKLTQQNAASAEESASSAEELSSQSEEMRSLVASFRLTGGGSLSQGGGGIAPKPKAARPLAKVGGNGHANGNGHASGSGRSKPEAETLIPFDDDDALQDF